MGREVAHVTGETSKGIRKACSTRHYDVLERNSFVIDRQNELEEASSLGALVGRSLAALFAPAAR